MQVCPTWVMTQPWADWQRSWLPPVAEAWAVGGVDTGLAFVTLVLTALEPGGLELSTSRQATKCSVLGLATWWVRVAAPFL